MAGLMTQDIPATPDQYDQVNQKMGVTDNPPDGLLIHTARRLSTVSAPSVTCIATSATARTAGLVSALCVP